MLCGIGIQKDMVCGVYEEMRHEGSEDENVKLHQGRDQIESNLATQYHLETPTREVGPRSRRLLPPEPYRSNQDSRHGDKHSPKGDSNGFFPHSSNTLASPIFASK